MNTKVVKRVVSGYEEDTISNLWEPDDHERQNMYKFALWQISVDLEVDLDTGKSRIVAVDGVELKKLGDFN